MYSNRSCQNWIISLVQTLVMIQYLIECTYLFAFPECLNQFKWQLFKHYLTFLVKSCLGYQLLDLCFSLSIQNYGLTKTVMVTKHGRDYQIVGKWITGSVYEYPARLIYALGYAWEGKPVRPTVINRIGVPLDRNRHYSWIIYNYYIINPTEIINLS